jgi:hypothetical protein
MATEVAIADQEDTREAGQMVTEAGIADQVDIRVTDQVDAIADQVIAANQKKLQKKLSALMAQCD